MQFKLKTTQITQQKIHETTKQTNKTTIGLIITATLAIAFNWTTLAAILATVNILMLITMNAAISKYQKEQQPKAEFTPVEHILTK